MASGEQYILRMVVDVKNDQALKALEKSVKSTAGAMPVLNKQMKNTASGFKNVGYQVQNASYQFTDFIVMVQGGINPMRAFSQQAPQLLAGFGAMGAAVGVAAALLPSLLLAFSRGASDIKSFKDEIEDVEGAVDGLTSTLSVVDFNSWNKTFNESTKINKQFLASIMAIKVATLEEEFRQQTKAVKKQAEEVDKLTKKQTFLNAMSQFQPMGMGAPNAMQQMMPEIQAAQEAANFVKKAGEDLEKGPLESIRYLMDEFSEGRIDMEDYAKSMVLVSGTVADDLSPAMREYIDQLRKVVENTESLKKAREQLEAVNQAVVTGEDLPEGSSKPKTGLTDEQRRVAALEREAAAYMKVYDPMENYRRKLEEINLYVTKYGLSQEAAAILAGKAAAEYEKAAAGMGDVYQEQFTLMDSMLGTIDQSFNSFINGLAQGTTELSDLFENMVKSIIAQLLKLMAYKAVFAGFGLDLSQGSIPWVSQQAKGGAWENGVQMFAKGGVVGGPTAFGTARGMGIMGEAGPEMIAPIRRMTDGTMGVGASPVNVTVNNNASGVAVQTVQNSDGGLTIEVIEEALTNKISQGGNQFSNAVQNTFGLNRQGAF